MEEYTGGSNSDDVRPGEADFLRIR